MERVKPPVKIVAVRGPDGNVLTLADLPPPGSTRWVASRKANVVAAVRGGLIGVDEACRRYRLSREEFQAWAEVFVRYGVRGLRATRRQPAFRHPQSIGPRKVTEKT